LNAWAFALATALREFGPGRRMPSRPFALPNRVAATEILKFRTDLVYHGFLIG